MHSISSIIEWMNEKFPPESAESWDNSGLLCGSNDTSTDAVVFALDLTSATIDRAIEVGAKLIITHHPIIFGGIKSVTNSDPIGKLLIRLIQNDIACFAAHTNIDVKSFYSNGVLAQRIGCDTWHDIEGVSCGVVGIVDTIKLGEYLKEITISLNASGVISINKTDSLVHKVFVQGGSFDEDSIPAILNEGVDTVVSGEIKHHIALLLQEYGINSIIAGHNATERVFMPYIAEALKKSFADLRIFVDNGNESIIK